MKFAKELEEDLVAEWSDKYLNYKQGKKKIKAVTRALRSIQKSPKTLSWKSPSLRRNSTLQRLPEGSPVDFPPSDRDNAGHEGEEHESPRADPLEQSKTQPLNVPAKAHQRADSADQNSDDVFSEGGTRWRRYGSIVGSPPSPDLSRPLSLNLGEPALDTASDDGLLGSSRSPDSRDESSGIPDGNFRPDRKRQSLPTASPSAFEVGRTRSPVGRRRSLGPRHTSDPNNSHRAKHGAGAEHGSVPFRERFSPKYRHMRYIDPTRAADFNPNREDPLFKRMFSRHGTKPLIPADVPMEAWKEVNIRQDQFWDFLDQELDKIETFYKLKEDESTARLDTIKRQLHVLRDHRQQDVNERRAAFKERKKQQGEHINGAELEHAITSPDSNEDGHHNIAGIHNLPHTKDAIFHPIKSAKQVQFRGNPQLLGQATPPTRPLDHMRDYSRKPEQEDHSYTSAKRKLKKALQEFYRGLELLKSYALLNRTAFRKINKKYDKAVHPAESMAYYAKVNQAWFVKSGKIDEYITAVEDLYARYFYNANRKVAASKLRRKNRLPDAFTQSVFRNGLALGLGLVLSIEAVVRAARDYYPNLIYDDQGNLVDTRSTTDISYTLQIYAGYFLLVFLMLFFCLDCRIFHRAKVNYVFIFEFDTRHNLDWRQLAELPCLFFFLMGLVMYLNYNHFGGDSMYTFWPLVLLCLTIVIVFLPAPTVYHESRRWFLLSLGRLLTPLRPVEFRDFFLGDMMCSETYSFGGIELLFCLYVNSFNNPSQCNSSHSRLFGFLQCLPGIIRLLQCFRRFYDTRQAFPHLANGAKYTCTILQYASLSVFRIDKSLKTRIFFIVCGVLNALATSTWDLLIDWSLMDPYANPPYLRTRLAYKRRWWYYSAMVVDPLLRFNWIFYAIPYFTDEIQHNSLLGFFVSFSEVFRRGIWTIFRVENEHCTNVGKFKASRDVELPYALTKEEESIEDEHLQRSTGPEARRPSHSVDYEYSRKHYTASPKPMSPNSEPFSGTSTGADLESGRYSASKSPATSSLRRRQQQQGITPSIPSPGTGLISRVGTMLSGAHAQDFERKKKSPGLDGQSQTAMQHPDAGADDEDDSDQQDTEMDGDADGDAEGTEEDDTMGPRARARRALSGTGGFNIGQSSAQSQQERQDREIEARNREDIEGAEEALRIARGEREDDAGAEDSD